MNNTKYSQEEVVFSHVYNGVIFTNTSYFPMIEFKIMPKNDTESKIAPVFTNVNFKRGWFIVNADPKNLRLDGPVNIDLEKIKTGVLQISDPNYSSIDGLAIESLSNDIDTIIHENDIPSWILKCLHESAGLLDSN